MEAANQIWCSTCYRKRDATDFQLNKSSVPMKTCIRHRKKRDIAQTFDAWDDFIKHMRDWNTPVSEILLAWFGSC